jgi:hypothetical protein
MLGICNYCDHTRAVGIPQGSDTDVPVRTRSIERGLVDAWSAHAGSLGVRSAAAPAIPGDVVVELLCSTVSEYNTAMLAVLHENERNGLNENDGTHSLKWGQAIGSSPLHTQKEDVAGQAALLFYIEDRAILASN